MSSQTPAEEQRPGSRRGDGMLLISALCAAGFTALIFQAVVEQATATWWVFLGCGASATIAAALARRTPRRTSLLLALLSTVPLAYVALIFAPVVEGWLAAIGMLTAFGAALALRRHA